MKKKAHGFTLIELMAVVAIIAILAAIAVPQYGDYVSRTRASSAMLELNSYRKAVSICATERSAGFVGCNAGSHGIPPVPASTTSNITAPFTVVDGVITATSAATDSPGGTELTIINTPSLANSALLVWTNTGTICDVRRGLKPGQGDCP